MSRGLDLPLGGLPAAADPARIEPAQPVRRVAYVGLDVRGPKRLPALEADVGDHVRLGQPLTRRKAYRQVVGTAPGTGVIEAIHRGPRRVLETIVIRLDDPVRDSEHPEDVEQETFNRYSAAEIAGLNRTQVIENLTASGAWLALRTRPFSMIADPGRQPAALFVTAMDSQPLAPDPVPLIRAAGEAFSDGLLCLAKLTDGPLWVCTTPDAGLPLPTGAAGAETNIRLAEFEGPHPAGLPGTHIHFLRPASLTHQVWHIGWQDVVAIGRLFRSGRIDPTRIISLAGPMVANPRVLRTRAGASTNDLIDGELLGAREARVISGSALTGRQAVGSSAYLGRFHNQITVLPEGRERQLLGWATPGRGRFSALNLFWSRRRGDARLDLNTSLQGSPRAMVPVGAYERVNPLDLLPTPLLRALIVNDIESAEALGALELDEEDLALLSFVDCGKYDYGPALRRNLDQIRREQS